MYLPHAFEVNDVAWIDAFIREQAAADLVTIDDQGQPVSTLMPCSWYRRDESHGTLVMHMARGNQQWKSIAEGARGLAIIHGPQAYVTPSWYESKVEHGKVVPTWNYTAVHLSGSVTVSHDQDHLRSIVSNLTDLHEAGRSTPWAVADAPEEYLAGQLKAIVAVTLHVDRIQAKAKLSQNRSQADQNGVAHGLAASTRPSDVVIANLMTAPEQ